jgi:hypothetical protein
MPYQQFNTIFISTPTFPLVHSQCTINETNMESPLHTICLDEGMEHSYIHAYYADQYLPNVNWTECECPLSGNDIHYTNITMTFQTTSNMFITLDVCLYRGSINTKNNIIVGTNDLDENNVTINHYDLLMDFNTTMESVELEQRANTGVWY